MNLRTLFLVTLATLRVVLASASDGFGLLTQQYQGVFWDEFTASFDRYGPRLFQDRLGNLETHRWIIRFHNDPKLLRDRIDSVALSSVLRSTEYSAREAFIESPGMSWLIDRKDALAIFLKNTIGSVEEEEVRTDVYSHREIEETWWNHLSSGGSSYGFRPFETSPYAFFAVNLANHREQPVLLNARYRFRNFKSHRFETTLAFRPYNGCTIDIGGLYEYDARGEWASIVA